MIQRKKTVVIGDFAKKARYQGAGSSNVNSTKVENILDLIDSRPIKYDGFAQGYQRNSERDEKLEQEARCRLLLVYESSN